MQLFLNIPSGMANCVDPDETDLVLHCLNMPFCQKLDVRNFRTFTLVLLYIG